jgi:hypothetical protein
LVFKVRLDLMIKHSHVRDVAGKVISSVAAICSRSELVRWRV